MAAVNRRRRLFGLLFASPWCFAKKKKRGNIEESLVLGSAISQKIRISEAVRNKFTCYLAILALRLQALLVDLADETKTHRFWINDVLHAAGFAGGLSIHNSSLFHNVVIENEPRVLLILQWSQPFDWFIYNSYDNQPNRWIVKSCHSHCFSFWISKDSF